MENWYEANIAKTLEHFNTNQNTGLSEQEAASRQTKYGKNEFEQQEKTSLIKDILHQLKDISTIILLLAALLSFCMAIKDGHGFIEPVVIVSIVILNLILAITQERSAEKALEALTSLNSPRCIVLRDGVQKEILPSWFPEM